MMARRPVVIGLLLSLLLVAGCQVLSDLAGGPGTVAPTAGDHHQPGTTPGTGEGGSAVIALWSPPEGIFNPVLARSEADATVNSLLYDTLLAYDERLEPTVPAMAAGYDISPDNLTVTFHLRDNILWHDGKIFTAEDVAFTVRTALRSHHAGKWLVIAGARAFVEGRSPQVAGIKVLDPATIAFTLEEPWAPFLDNFAAQGIIARHAFPDDDPSAMETAPSTRVRPVGTGPFQLRQSGPDLVSLTASEQYYRGRPRLAGVIFRVVEAETALARLEQGDVDLMELDPLTAGPATAMKGITLRQWPGSTYQYIGINLRQPILQDPLVRRALAEVIDRRALVREILGGYGSVIDGPVLPGSWAWSPDGGGNTHDPEKARRLLAEAGWQDEDGDGRREKDGDPLRLLLLFPSGDREKALVAHSIQEDLRQVGIDLEIEPLDLSLLARRVFEHRDFELYLLGWGLGADPDPGAVWLPTSRWNVTGFNHPLSEQLLVRGVQTWNRGERRGIYSQWTRLLNEEVPYIFLYNRYRLVAVNERIKGADLGLRGLTAGSHLWWTDDEGAPE